MQEQEYKEYANANKAVESGNMEQEANFEKLKECLSEACRKYNNLPITLSEMQLSSLFPYWIQDMNIMYKLPSKSSPEPEDEGGDRLGKFKSIIQEEVDELNEIKSVDDYIQVIAYDPEEAKLEYLTKLADLLGDVVIFCFSEALRNGLDLPAVLAIIMQSNFNKLGADGKPIYDERGKFLKGPNYWKPEPLIKELIRWQRNQPLDNPQS